VDTKEHKKRFPDAHKDLIDKISGTNKN